MLITENLSYESLYIKDSKIHITVFNQSCPQSTLLISKLSEAILPNTDNNHIGEGSNIDEVLKKQKGIRFIINGGFNHYKKNFYEWPHDNYKVGDPVGLVKIRNHYFEDLINKEYYGFFTQEDKGKPWVILDKVVKGHKYILGCTPLLIFNSQTIPLPEELLKPLPSGKINPPSVLAHGNQKHPRTAIGIKEEKIYFITVESGITLVELQDVGEKLQLESLLNLDGGGSSQFRLYHEGKYIQSSVAPEDINRVLGHAIVIFDRRL